MTPFWAPTSGANSDNSIRPTVARSRWPCSMLVNRARLVFSQSCSGVAVRREPQIVDHRVYIVFELGDLAARIDLNRPGEITLGHGSGDFGDRPHLRRQIGCQ